MDGGRFLLACAGALHPEEEALGWGELSGRWTPSVGVWLMLAAIASIYASGVRRLWRHAGRGRGVRRWEAGAYAAGIASLALALLSPLDRLSDVSFVAHMSQHEILMLVSAPLVALARPMVAGMWALPATSRQKVAALTQTAWVRKAWRTMSHPMVVLCLHAVIVWIWHMRVLFDGAMRNEWVHGLQHASFFVTAALFWWALVFGRYGRGGYGVAVLFVFATAAHTSLLGALLATAQRVWYAAYASGANAVGLDPLEDQRLAGLVMWIPGGLIFLLAALALLLAWLGEARRRADRRPYDALPVRSDVGTVVASAGAGAVPGAASASTDEGLMHPRATTRRR
jgi:putative membrane protein